MKRPPEPQMTRGRQGYERQDWDAVNSPELTDAETATLRPFADAFPVLAENIRLARGPQKSPTKVRVTLRLDRSTLEAFKADGPGWQTRIGEALAKAKG